MDNLNVRTYTKIYIKNIIMKFYYLNQDDNSNNNNKSTSNSTQINSTENQAVESFIMKRFYRDS